MNNHAIDKSKKPAYLELLGNIDLFSCFPEKTLNHLVDHCKVVILEDQEVLCREGEVENKMYVILSGELLIYKLKKNIDISGPGEYLGEMSLIDSKPRSASVRGLGNAIVLEISSDDFHNFIMPEPQALFSIMKNLTNRTRHHLDIISSECQKLNCLVHDMRNCLVPLGISEAHLDRVLDFLSGTEEGQKKRKGWEELDIGFKKMKAVKNNLITLIDQTLVIGTKSRADYVKTRGDLIALIQETIEETSLHKYVTGKQFKTNFPGSTLEAEFNFIDIKRVLQNLIVNAGYASEKNGLIEVEVQVDDKDIQVSLVDHGEGIPDDIKPLLLKEKYTSKSDGNGLGLLSCREIVEDCHGGRFWFESKLGEGTTFHFSIPG